MPTIARDLAKVLRSAVANAQQKDGFGGDVERLYVSACFADEGPTLKRWRPRARGRATRIRKRTCHITVIVSQLPEDRLTVLRNAESAKAAARGGRGRTVRDAADARRRRVAASRAEDAPADEPAPQAATDEVPATAPVTDAETPATEEGAE